MLRRFGWSWSLLLVACVGPPTKQDGAKCERTIVSIALADPVFGGGATVEQRLFGSAAYYRPQGDPETRAAFAQLVRAQADADALALARELVPADLAEAVAEFLGSPAGASQYAAETLALSAYPWPANDFAAQTTSAYADANRVGAAAAAARLRELATTAADSVSPAQLAIEMGAMRVQPDEARKIRAFHATDVGARWIAVRGAALVRSEARFREVVKLARAQGFLGADLGLDTPLPTSLPRTPPSADPPFRLSVDPQGNVRCAEKDLGNVANPDSLREALRALRAKGIAEGKLSLAVHQLEGQMRLLVNESLGIEGVDSVAWAQIDALLKLCAEPELAFWTIDLAVDPKIVPESLRATEKR